MRIGGLGLPELLVILLVVLLLFGAKRLPEIGSSLGRSISEFKKGLAGEGGKEETEDKSTNFRAGDNRH